MYKRQRQQFLIDQGYAFRVIMNLVGQENMPGLVYSSKSEQIELLQSVLIASESAADFGSDVKPGESASAAPSAKRMMGSLNALGGAQHMSYVERNRSMNKSLPHDQPRHKAFQKRAANAKKKQ